MLPVIPIWRRVVCILLVALACGAAAGSVPGESTVAATLQASADRGDAAAQLMLGERLRAGAGMPRDAEGGAAWIRRAALQGDARAQYILGTIMIAGRGVPKDRRGALAWLRKAADRRVVDAEYALGSALIESGEAGRPDYAAGLPWIREAAESGSRLAQARLADLLAGGLGAAPRPAEALEWYRRAARHGSVHAYWQLARLGRAVEPERFEQAMAGPHADADLPRQCDRRIAQQRLALAHGNDPVPAVDTRECANCTTYQ